MASKAATLPNGKVSANAKAPAQPEENIFLFVPNLIGTTALTRFLDSSTHT